MDEPRYEATITTMDELRRALDAVSFAQSCIDMGWKWQVRPIFVPVSDTDAPYAGPEGHVGLAPNNTVIIGDRAFGLAWEIRCSFRRPERETGVVGEGFGRWWPVDPGITESGLWKTMYLAVTTNVTHEVLEAYKVLGFRPFDPHRSIRDLINLPLPAGRAADATG